jgi:diguanylate cyclase (GGDEF)-like protein
MNKIAEIKSKESSGCSTESFDTEHARRLSQIAAFNEVGKILTSTVDLPELLQTVMEQVGTLLKPKDWSLLLLDEEKDELYFEITVGEAANKLGNLRLKVGEGIAGHVAKEMQPMLVTDVSKDPLFSNKADLKTGFKTESIACVPLKSRGKCLGVIELINTANNNGFDDEDLTILETIADYTAIAIDNAKLFKQVQDLSVTDDLTGLYNSRFLHHSLGSEVNRARRFKYDLSLIFMDLDYFKSINDNHGHLSGSKLLKEVGALIDKTVRNVDLVCRYGGDEFVIVMPETSKEHAGVVAKKIREAFRSTTFLKDEGLNCKMTGSFGVASYPDDAANENELIQLADIAMYKVKNRTRDGVEMA